MTILHEGGPIRGLRNVEGKLYCVSGDQLFQVTEAGVSIPRGAIPSVGRVSMAHNQNGAGQQVTIANGMAGYVLHTATNIFAKITDDGFPGASIVDYIDGYTTYVDPSGRRWGHSDLYDSTTYNTLDRYEAEGDPDRIVTQVVSNREVIILGRNTTEIYNNTGAATGTFQRATNTVIPVGCAAKFSPAILDGRPFFLDNHRRVRVIEAYNARRVSHTGIERVLAECPADAISRAYGMAYEDRGHACYILTVPGHVTFVYHVLSNRWTRLQSKDRPDWRVSHLAYFNGGWVAADAYENKLYTVDWDYFFDGQTELIREFTTGPLWDAHGPIIVNEIELGVSNGGLPSTVAEFAEQPEGPFLEQDVVIEALSGEALDIDLAIYAINGDAPLVRWELRESSAPEGTTLGADGRLTGNAPAEEGDYRFTARCIDANGPWDEAEFILRVASE